MGRRFRNSIEDMDWQASSSNSAKHATQHGNGGCGIQAPDKSGAGYFHKHIQAFVCEPISGTQTETSGTAKPEL